MRYASQQRRLRQRDALGAAGGARSHEDQRRFVGFERDSLAPDRRESRQRGPQFAEPGPGAGGGDHVVLLQRGEFRVYPDGNQPGLPGGEQRYEEIERIGMADHHAVAVCEGKAGQLRRFSGNRVDERRRRQLAPAANADKPGGGRYVVDERHERVGQYRPAPWIHPRDRGSSNKCASGRKHARTASAGGG